MGVGGGAANRWLVENDLEACRAELQIIEDLNIAETLSDEALSRAERAARDIDDAILLWLSWGDAKSRSS